MVTLLSDVVFQRFSVRFVVGRVHSDSSLHAIILQKSLQNKQFMSIYQFAWTTSTNIVNLSFCVDENTQTTFCSTGCAASSALSADLWALNTVNTYCIQGTAPPVHVNPTNLFIYLLTYLLLRRVHSLCGVLALCHLTLFADDDDAWEIRRSWRSWNIEMVFSRLHLKYGRAYASVVSVCLSSSVVCTECIVAKRCVLKQKLLLTAKRKSYVRNRLVPKWMTLTFV